VEGTEPAQKPSRSGWLAGILVVLGIVAAGLHFVSTGLGCAFDTSYCAYGGGKVERSGRVFSRDGNPLAGVRLDFTMESARGHAQPSVVTDDKGYFCFKWPGERIVPTVSVSGTPPRPSLPPDPRFSDPRVLDPRFAAPQELEDRSPPYQPTTAPVVVHVGHGFLSATDPRTILVTATDLLADPAESTRPCPASKVQPPWYRVDNATGSWRSLLIYAAAALALVLLLASRASATRGPALRRGAVIAVAVEALLLAAVWSLGL
jgi:hypothetical protein